MLHFSNGDKSHPLKSHPFVRQFFYQVRRVLDVIRGRSYEEALMLTEYMPYKACETILKVLMSVGGLVD